MKVHPNLVPVFDALKEQCLRYEQVKRCFSHFFIRCHNHDDDTNCLDDALFVNPHADGIEILIGQQHRAALEQSLGKKFNCVFRVVGNPTHRHIATASIDWDDGQPPWLITLITPIHLNLQAEERMFEQLRAEYGVGGYFHAVLERRGVIPSLRKLAELCEASGESLWVCAEAVGITASSP